MIRETITQMAGNTFDSTTLFKQVFAVINDVLAGKMDADSGNGAIAAMFAKADTNALHAQKLKVMENVSAGKAGADSVNGAISAKISKADSAALHAQLFAVINNLIAGKIGADSAHSAIDAMLNKADTTALHAQKFKDILDTLSAHNTSLQGKETPAGVVSSAKTVVKDTVQAQVFGAGTQLIPVAKMQKGTPTNVLTAGGDGTPEWAAAPSGTTDQTARDIAAGKAGADSTHTELANRFNQYTETWYAAHTNPGATNMVPYGTFQAIQQTNGGTAYNSDSADGTWATVTTGGVGTSNAGFHGSTSDAVNRSQQFEFVSYIKTGNTVEGLGIWNGFFAATSDSLSNPNTSVAAFRYWQGWDNTLYWRCWSSTSSAAHDSTITSVVVAPSTPYRMRIVMSATSIKYYIRVGVGADELVATHTTNIPVATTGLIWRLHVYTFDKAVAKKISAQYLKMKYPW